MVQVRNYKFPDSKSSDESFGVISIEFEPVSYLGFLAQKDPTVSNPQDTLKKKR